VSADREVLITGCSSGIGAATALGLARAGFRVVATARRPETLDGLRAAGCEIEALDVNDEASMAGCVERVLARHGALYGLVNNAGYSLSGAVESLPLARVRQQFETNVFGALRMIQLVAPGMRAAGRGRIVNVGSMGGRMTLPGGGVYHATKYALEALSDALRFELAGFGVDVVLVQPGIIKTGFAEAVAREMSPPSPDDPYAAFNAAVQKATIDAYEAGPLGRYGGGTPDTVARVIERALTASRPRTRYLVTPSAHFMVGLRAWLPDRAWDAFVATAFPRPGAKG
jgi:NAD(P)-dependent dehydrogenase (short-subunit alcohol dehydrogenase family)